MKWCCEAMKYMFEQRTGRTIFVFAEAQGNGVMISFWLGMRCINKADLERVRLLRLPSDIPLTINTRVPVKWCPWCGINLAKYYRKGYFELLDQEISKEFLGGIDSTRIEPD